MGLAQTKSIERRSGDRFDVKIKRLVEIKLFGTTETYRLFTVNVSQSGLLLEGPMDLTHFNQASILEVRLHVEEDCDPICFVGRFARRANKGAVGIRISDIDPTNKQRYRDFVIARAAENEADGTVSIAKRRRSESNR